MRHSGVYVVRVLCPILFIYRIILAVFSIFYNHSHGSRSTETQVSRSLSLHTPVSVSHARGHAARSARASARPPPGRRPARGAASMKDILRFTGVVLKPVSCIHPHAY